MTPSPFVWLILSLAAFRLTRLIGWDDFPPVARLRSRLVREGDPRGRAIYADAVLYGRPLLAKFVHCAWCVGFWVSALVYAVWAVAPTEALYVAVPFAISAAVGLLAKNLDP